MPAWLDAHIQAFDYFRAVRRVIIPDDASTAFNKITATSTAQDIAHPSFVAGTPPIGIFSPRMNRT